MNKIKASSNAVKMKYIIIAFAVSLLVSIPLRVYHLLALVDSSNGFYTDTDISVPVFYGLIVVFGLLFLVMSYICKGVPSPKPIVGKNPILGVAAFVAAGGFAWNAVQIVYKNVPDFSGNSRIFTSLLISNIQENGGTFIVLEAIFALLSVIYCVVFGISYMNGNDIYKKYKILALSPLFWVMAQLVSRLMQATSFIKSSELLLEIFACVFMMLFFFTFARISTGVYTENSMWGIYGYGFTGSLLTALITIPRIVVSAAGLDPVTGSELDISHVTCLLFTVVYILTTLGVGFKDGIVNRKAVNELELPDESIAVTKKENEED